MNTIKDEVAEQKRRDEDAALSQKILDDALTADLSHAKDRVEEDRIQKRYNDETAAAKAKRDEGGVKENK